MTFTHTKILKILALVTSMIMLHTTVIANDEAAVKTPEEAGIQFLKGFKSFAVPKGDGGSFLAGRTMTIDFAGGKFRVRHDFLEDGETLAWEVLTGANKGNTGEVKYFAQQLRPGITFVTTQPRDIEAVTIVIDENRGAAAGFLGRNNPEVGGNGIEWKKLYGPILESNIKGDRTFENGSDLAGTHFRVTYPGEAAIYEHLYLSEHYVTWLALKGTSAGAADTEHFKAFQIAPGLYIAAWKEKSAPLQLTFLFDFEKNVELASFFGYDASQDRNVYQVTSAVISETKQFRYQKNCDQ